MPSRGKSSGRFPAQRRKHHMAMLAGRENRLARRRRELTPKSSAEAHSKVAQKVTPWKNYLAETKRPNENFARHGVTPCGSQFEAHFLLRSPQSPGHFQSRQPTLLDLVKSIHPISLLLAQFDSPRYHKPAPSRSNRTSLLRTNRTFSLRTATLSSASCHAPRFSLDSCRHAIR
jgi:hypothetical protein